MLALLPHLLTTSLQECAAAAVGRSSSAVGAITRPSDMH
jgi:hypothetical protein